MTEPELKPCPFCGSNHILFREQVGAYEIYCQDCDANVGITNTFEEAVAAWNRRNAKPEPEPASEPAPDRREILEAKKEKYLRILIAEIHSMEETLQHPFTVGAAVCAKSNVYQAAYDLGEVVFELAQIEKGGGKN